MAETKESIYLQEIRDDLNEFYKHSNREMPDNSTQQSKADMPGVISLLPIKKVALPIAVINLLLRIPLKVIRKATHPYYLYQKQENENRKRRLDRLDSRVMELAKQIEVLEKRTKK